MSPADPLSIAREIGSILDRLEIRYVIGGSVASSVWGEPRTTVDLDLMIDGSPEAIGELVEALKDTFYIDRETALEAYDRRGLFNAIHFESSMKVDFFMSEADEIANSQLERRRGLKMSGVVLYFYSPEDLIVRKMMWFRSGGEQSQRQWRDILGILRTSSLLLDDGYLRSAAGNAGVVDLLERARNDLLAHD